MRVMMENTIAIVVDYQEKLVPAMNNAEILINNSRILLEGLRVLDVPMIITQQYTKGLGSTVKPVLQAVQGEDSSVEISHIEKISFSAYSDIKEYLQDKKYVIVCGIEAHICVLQTVIDLVAEGYIPVLVADCISSRKESDKKYALNRAMQEGAIITTYEAILFELLGKAGSDKSRQIQRLIK